MNPGLKHVLILSIVLPAMAFAHTAFKQATPASGSIMSTSPETVTLEFAQAVQLTLVNVESADGNNRQLGFSPRGSSERFETVPPDLTPGQNTIHWKALSPDGHVIEGTVILVLRPEQLSRPASQSSETLAENVR